jgi:hypothetical protein
VGVGVILGGVPVTAAAESPRPGARVETPVSSAAPDADRVEESYVRIYKPLPDSAGPHPKRCDWIGYLRFRNRGGPREASRADAVFVSMPGIFAGASMHDQLARNVVRRAAKQDEEVEYWALDRRANCLEDHRGVEAAGRQHDPRAAFDYYWGNRRVDGRRFGGFKSAEEASFLRRVGLAQTVRDWRAVIRQDVPSREVRKRKVFCGGHSLGGPLTTAFAGWDFDGDPETKGDAGYKQCAGLFGLDTSLGFDSSGGGPSEVGAAKALARASGSSPYLNVPPFTPETIQLLGPIGVGAYHGPRGARLIDQIPRTPNIELTERFLFSRDAVNFATGEPSIRDFRLTDETVLAGIFDDNSVPVTIMRTSLGTVEGGPVAEKDFPTPEDLSMFPGLTAPLVNNDFTMIPSRPRGPLYRWRSYSRMRGAPAQLNDSGERFTSERSEFADAHEFARTMFEAPANWAEQYFPTRIVTDLGAAEGGDRSGNLRNLRYDGVAKRPAFLIQAGDSDRNTGAKPEKESDSEPPNGKQLSGSMTLRGYNHIDVVAAAWRQSNGRPERSSESLAKFALRVIDRR